MERVRSFDINTRDLVGEKYAKLITWAHQQSDAIMVRVDGSDEEDWESMEAIRRRLEPYQIKVMPQALCWPGSQQFRVEDMREALIMYRCDPAILEFLLEPGAMTEWYPPNYPRDLSFYKRGVCWMYTTIDEYLCLIYGLNEGTEEMLGSLHIPYRTCMCVRSGRYNQEYSLD